MSLITPAPVRAVEHTAHVLAAHDYVVRGAPVELHQTQFRLGPLNAVVGDRIADAHLPGPRRDRHVAMTLWRALVDRRRCRALVDDERAVPTLIDLFLLVVDHIGVDIIEPRFPWPVLTEQRIPLVLAH